MNKKKVGDFLTARKNQLGLNSTQIAQRVGRNRTTSERIERGISGIRRRDLIAYANAYEVDPAELAKLCGYPIETIPNLNAGLQVTASVEDLEFLVTVARGLQKPLTVDVMVQLLKCRKP